MTLSIVNSCKDEIRESYFLINKIQKIYSFNELYLVLRYYLAASEVRLLANTLIINLGNGLSLSLYSDGTSLHMDKINGF